MLGKIDSGVLQLKNRLPLPTALYVSVMHNFQLFHNEIDNGLLFIISFMATLFCTLAEFVAVDNRTYLYDNLVLANNIAQHIGRVIRNT